MHLGKSDLLGTRRQMSSGGNKEALQLRQMAALILNGSKVLC